MHRENLSALVRRIPSRQLNYTVRFVCFLTGSVPSDPVEDILAALEHGDPQSGNEYIAPRELHEYGELDPWEVDVAEAREYLQTVTGSIPDEDVRPACRFIEYLLHDSLGEAEAERNVHEFAKTLDGSGSGTSEK